MVRKIQHKRGPEKDLPRLEIAEWALTTDTEKPFIGAASGNVEIAKKKDVEAVSSEVSKKADAAEVTALGSQLADTSQEVETVKTTKADKTYVDEKTQATALSFKESYATLADLQAAYPTGDTFNHAVLADGMIYTYVNSAWTNTQIQANGTGLADKTVTPEKTTFITPGRNIFKGGFQQFAVVRAADTLAPQSIVSSDTARMAVIPIESGKMYTVTTYTPHNRKTLLLSNSLPANNAPIQKVVFNNDADTSPVTFTNTEGYKYLLVYVSNASQEPTLQVEEGSTSTPYEPYQMALDKTVKFNVALEEIEDVNIKKNLFNGTYTNLYINNNINSPFISSTAAARTAVIGIGSGDYSIVAEGEFNRFVVALSNSISLNAVTVPQVWKTSGVKPEETLTVSNTEGYSYLLIYVSNASQEPNLYVYEGDTPVKSDRIFLKEQEVAKREDIPNIEELNIKRYQSYYESELVDGGFIASHKTVHSNYDQLVTNHPDYVSAEVLGTNAEGNELRSYIFSRPTIRNYTNVKKPKIGIVSGTHGNEKSPVSGLYNFMSDLCKNKSNNEMLDMLKSYVDIYVIPVSNPTGYDNNTRQNGNMVDLNRNFETNWEYIPPGNSYSGEIPKSELETQIITDWLHTNQFDHVIDFHNTGNTIEYDFSWLVATGDHTDELTRRYTKAVSLVGTLWSNKYEAIPKDRSFGYVDFYKIATVQAEGVTSGAKSVTLEVTWQISELDEKMFGMYTNTFATDMLGNYLLEILKEFM